MKKDTRNRRSTSSCSSYSPHSVSVAQLQSAQSQPQLKKPEFTQIQKSYLQIYSQIKGYVSNERVCPDWHTLSSWKNIMKTAIQKTREYFKCISSNIMGLKTSVSNLQSSKNEQIISLKAIQEDELKIKENQNRRQIIAISEDFYRKEQEYKQVITKFIETLHNSQISWSKLYAQLTAKVKKADEILKIENRKNQDKGEYWGRNQQSIDSINLSHEDIASGGVGSFCPQPESRPNTIDISSIQQILPEQVPQQQQSMELQQILSQLIRWGFFSEQNQNNINKLMNMTKNLSSGSMLLNLPIYPILIESIRLQLKDEDESFRADEQNIHDISDCKHNFDHPSRMPMNDIHNYIL